MDYLPAESNTGMFGGNSNWRGPIWMPVNALIIRALLNFYLYYGDNFKIECPTGSGKMMNLFEVSKEIADRLTRIFTARRAWPAARLRRHGEVPDRSPLARSHPLLRILPRRQRRRAGRQPSDRLDRAVGQDHPALRTSGCQADTCRRQGGDVCQCSHNGRSKKRCKSGLSEACPRSAQIAAGPNAKAKIRIRYRESAAISSALSAPPRWASGSTGGQCVS